MAPSQLPLTNLREMGIQKKNGSALTETPKDAHHKYLLIHISTKSLMLTFTRQETSLADHQGTWTTLQEHLSKRI